VAFGREEADMTLASIIGPILKRGEQYVFDTWSAREGLLRGFPYRRIDHAHYARQAAIRTSARGTVICQTLDEFHSRTAAAALPLAA
jgi:hypothetical protein